MGSNFFGVDLDQFVTVPAARNMKCEVCGYKFLFASSTECPHCGDAREAIVAANLDANAHTEPQNAPKRPFEHDPDVIAVTDEMVAAAITAYLAHDGDWPEEIPTMYRAMAAVAPREPPQIPIMDSTVGLKAANAHLTRRVAELEGEKSRGDIVAQNITPAAGLPPLGVEAWFETAMAYRAEIDDLTRQLAAQALAHAEQMEEIRKDWAWSNSEWLETVEMKDARIAELKSELSAMRVTPATQPTDAQQTASDTKPAAQPKAFPASALNPPRTDQRRVGQ